MAELGENVAIQVSPVIDGMPAQRQPERRSGSGDGAMVPQGQHGPVVAKLQTHCVTALTMKTPAKAGLPSTAAVLGHQARHV